MKYYISRAGKTFGPYSLTDLQTMAAQGNLSLDDMAWSEGLNTWVPASQVLGNIASPPPPPAMPSSSFGAAQSPNWTPPPQSQSAFQSQPIPASGTASPYQPGIYQPQPVPGAGPVPPSLHWALVMLLSFVTCGIFGIVWMFIQSGFVKRIDPSSNATLFYVLYLAGYFVGAAVSSGGGDSAALGGLLMIGGIVLVIVAIFSVKNSLESYYTSVEPIGLQLSGGMTFFFNILYFQYHLTRIAEWKRTGRLA